MSDPIALPGDLALLIGQPVDVPRAKLILELLQEQAETIITPLPPAARSVIIGAALRAYSNPSSAHTVGVGTATVAFGAAGSQSGIGGIYLSRYDIAALRRMTGTGEAFTVDPTAQDAGTGLPPWSQNVTWLNGIPNVDQFGTR